MTKNYQYDAIVVGSGPNGLAAAITMAQSGASVAIFEAKETIGGGLRTAELTLPGFKHDICSAILPLGIASPFFKSLPLEKYGLKWIQPLAPLAHPFEDGTAALLENSIEKTCQTLNADGLAYKQLIEPLVANWDKIEEDILGPLHFPKHPLAMARFGLLAFRSAKNFVSSFFTEKQARGMFIGLAAHSILPLDKTITAAFALVLGILGHKSGWPIVSGGSERLADALASHFLSLGGKTFTHAPIKHMDDLPSAKVYFFDVTPNQLVQIAGNRFPAGYVAKLKKYRYGPGVFKMDWALSQPIPWKAKECLRAATVHIGGTEEEIEYSEAEVWKGNISDKPFVLMAQPSLFDSTRAPPGQHTAWGYCHVPNGSRVDMTDLIENQIERYAPGFRDCILAKSTKNTLELEHYNANYMGGDINGGVQDIWQFFTRPVARLVPYSTPAEDIFICSSSTPPGGGVHGMCGYHAAKAALKNL